MDSSMASSSRKRRTRSYARSLKTFASLRPAGLQWPSRQELDSQTGCEVVSSLGPLSVTLTITIEIIFTQLHV